ncbi:MAG: rhodanese-like domain-containing protein [Gammaproteobacteria bacterium]
MQDIQLFIQNHLMLCLGLAIVLVILVIVEFIKIKRGGNRLTPAKMTQLINHEKAVIIDVRAQDAFLSGHIVGAISLPLSDIKNKMKKIEKFKSQPVVIICAAGTESSRAAAILTQEGFNNVQTLNGGIRAWRDAELPLVKG